VQEETPVDLAAFGAAGPKGDPGPPGQDGAAGAPGTALAYARVSYLGVVDAATSKNIASANVSHPGDGIYCIAGLAFTPHNIMAVPEVANAVLQVRPGALVTSPCTGSQGEVLTSDLSGVLVDRDFQLLIN
jgi:hypothetical protein